MLMALTSPLLLKSKLPRLKEWALRICSVCMAKTQYSFSDDASKLGAPRNFTIATVREVGLSAGRFCSGLTGNVNDNACLGKNPAAFKIDVDESGKISACSSCSAWFLLYVGHCVVFRFLGFLVTIHRERDFYCAH